MFVRFISRCVGTINDNEYFVFQIINDIEERYKLFEYSG